MPTDCLRNVNDEITTTTFIQKLQRGDATAWDRFEFIHQPVIRHLCKDTMEPADVEIVVQLTQEKVRSCIDSFERRPGKLFRSFIRKVARSQIVNHLKKLERADRNLLEHDFDNVYEEFEIRQAVEIIRQERAFPEQSWEIFRLRYDEGVPLKEIAVRISKSLDTVYRTRQRMLKAIQETLEGN